MRRDAYGHIINMVGLSGHRIPDGPQVREGVWGLLGTPV